MKNNKAIQICMALLFGLLTSGSFAAGGSHGHEGGPACEGFGPQTPPRY